MWKLKLAWRDFFHGHFLWIHKNTDINYNHKKNKVLCRRSKIVKKKKCPSDNDYGMEEVEEVEEEVVDEGIEEDQPPIQHSLPPTIVTR